MPYSRATICLNGHIVSKAQANSQKYCSVSLISFRNIDSNGLFSEQLPCNKHSDKLFLGQKFYHCAFWHSLKHIPSSLHLF